MSFKLFIIPWILSVSYVMAQAPPASNDNLYMNPSVFYDFLQRQQQYNNALLLNNALLTNRMTAAHPSQMSAGLIFHPSFATLANQIPNQFQQSNQQFNLLNRHVAVQNGGALELIGAKPRLSDIQDSSEDFSTTTSATTATASYSTSQIQIHKNDQSTTVTSPSPIAVNQQVLVEEEANHTSLEDKSPPGETSSESSNDREKTSSSNTQSSSHSDLYGLLKNINLTDDEKSNLVHYVQEIVKEELAKKLSQNTTDEGQHAKQNKPVPEGKKETSTTLPLRITNLPKTTTTAPKENLLEDPEVHETTTVKSTTLVTPGTRVIVELPEIKLHPPKRLPDKDLVIQSNLIKTSDKHILMAEKMTEEEAGEKNEKSHQGNQEITTSGPSVDRKLAALTSNHDATDEDLLELETGSPLDLSEAELMTSATPAYRSRFKNRNNEPATSAPKPKAPMQISQVPPRVRPNQHPPTTFDKLAKDYRERLSGTGDINKILKSFYENAYIQLIANESRQHRRSRKLAVRSRK